MGGGRAGLVDQLGSCERGVVVGAERQGHRGDRPAGVVPCSHGDRSESEVDFAVLAADPVAACSGEDAAELAS